MKFISPMWPVISSISKPALSSRLQIRKSGFRISNEEVTILSHQDSAMLNSFAQANALVFLPEGKYEVCQNDKVLVYTI